MTLIHYYKLDEASGNAVDSVGSKNLTQSGTVGSATGKINNARSFTAGNVFSIPYNQAETNRTYTLWFKANSLSDTRSGLIEKEAVEATPGSRLYFTLNVRATSFEVSIYNHLSGGEVLLFVPMTVNTGTWYFIAVALDWTNKKIKLSINGGAFTDQTYVYTFDEIGSSDTLRLGFTEQGTTRNYDGLIDEVGYFNEVLSVAQVQTIYNGGNGLALENFNTSLLSGISTFSGNLNVHNFTPAFLGVINSNSTLSGSLDVIQIPENTEVNYTSFLTSDIDVNLNWDILDDDQETLQTDVGDLQPEYDFDENEDVNQAWYDSIFINSNSISTLDLTMLPTQIFGMSIIRGFSNINQLVIENTSPSSYLRLGTSGVSNSIDNFGYISEIGYSGIMEITSHVGFQIDATHKNLCIRNPTNSPVTCKILILGTGA
jgi:hypothetical protein